MLEIQTLCLIKKDGKLLLGLKKRGFGAGRWNGFGGKIEADETIEEAAIRELHEEAGITATKIKKMGEFTFNGVTEGQIEVHLFEAQEFEGEPQESEEMRPAWFELDQIPFDFMWPDDFYWLPYFIKGAKTKGIFNFQEGNIIDFSLEEVEDFAKKVS